jgi:hypothetical protein
MTSPDGDDFSLWMTCTGDGREHAVSDAQFAVGRGRYLARCGHLVVPGSLCAPPGSACRTCVESRAAAWGSPGRPRRVVDALSDLFRRAD